MFTLIFMLSNTVAQDQNRKDGAKAWGKLVSELMAMKHPPFGNDKENIFYILYNYVKQTS